MKDLNILRRARLEKEPGLNAAAWALGVSYPTLAAWESGVFAPKENQIPKYAEFLGLDPMDVFEVIWEFQRKKKQARLVEVLSQGK